MKRTFMPRVKEREGVIFEMSGESEEDKLWVKKYVSRK